MPGSKIQILRDEFKNSSFTTKQAIDLGVSKRMLNFYLEKGQIERVRRGLYIFPDYDVDQDHGFYDLVLVAKSIKDSVICLISALGYWDITDEFQRDYWLAIPNNHPLPKSQKGIRFFRPRDLKTGVIEKVIAEVKVKITTPERSICDAFKYLDEETAITSLRTYISEFKEVDIESLLNTAKELKVNQVLDIMREMAEASAKGYPRMDREIFRAYTKWLRSKKESKK